MNPDLELIQQYAQAIQATGLLEEDTVNGITAMVDRARDQFRVADEQGIPRETLQLLPDDQRAAMQEVLMQVQRSYSARSEGEMMNERSYQVDNRMERMTPAEMQRQRSLDPNSVIRENERSYQVDDGMMSMPPSQMAEMQRKGEISPDTIYENIDGLDIARRPTAPATSPRPKPRPANLGTMGQTRPQMRPQLRPRDYDITNPKYEVEGGGQIRRQDIINSPSLTEEQKRAMLGGNLPRDYDITNPKYEK